MKEKKSRVKYTSDMPRRLYRYFTEYAEGGVPSFVKFARSAGLTLADLERFRGRREFDRAYRECEAIRRDLLIDGGLTRRFDPSFTKFLLTLSDEQDAREDINDLTFRLEVKE